MTVVNSCQQRCEERVGATDGAGGCAHRRIVDGSADISPLGGRGRRLGRRSGVRPHGWETPNRCRRTAKRCVRRRPLSVIRIDGCRRCRRSRTFARGSGRCSRRRAGSVRRVAACTCGPAKAGWSSRRAIRIIPSAGAACAHAGSPRPRGCMTRTACEGRCSEYRPSGGKDRSDPRKRGTPNRICHYGLSPGPRRWPR